MNEIIAKKKPQWQCFDQEWIDLDWFEYVIFEAYEQSASSKDAPTFDDIRESQWVAEDILMPVVSYYAFGDEQEYMYMQREQSEHFMEVYEDTFSEVENDIIGMIWESNMFLHIYDDHYFHIPLVEVW